MRKALLTLLIVAGCGTASGTNESTGVGGAAGAAGEAGAGGEGGGGGGYNLEYCETVEQWDAEGAEMEAEVARLVNEYRSQGADCGSEKMPVVPALLVDPALVCAARRHSQDMVERGFLSHDNPDGEDSRVRILQAGFVGLRTGENIAEAFDSPQALMDAFMASELHCRNIMDARFEALGVGYYPGGEFGHLWTQTFGG